MKASEKLINVRQPEKCDDCGRGYGRVLKLQSLRPWQVTMWICMKKMMKSADSFGLPVHRPIKENCIRICGIIIRPCF